jgi:hypothetical protein
MHTKIVSIDHTWADYDYIYIAISLDCVTKEERRDVHTVTSATIQPSSVYV